MDFYTLTRAEIAAIKKLAHYTRHNNELYESYQTHVGLGGNPAQHVYCIASQILGSAVDFESFEEDIKNFKKIQETTKQRALVYQEKAIPATVTGPDKNGGLAYLNEQGIVKGLCEEEDAIFVELLIFGRGPETNIYPASSVAELR
jgi:hypothetical protein